MIANILITTILVISGMILISEVTAFWNDRTDLGNASTVGAVVIVLLYFATGIWQIWK